MILNDTYLSTTIDESGIISAEVLTAQIANLKTHFTQLYTKAKKCTDNTGTIKTDKIVKDLEEFRAETLEISAKVFQVQESISRTRAESAFLHTNSSGPAVTPPEREIPERLVAMLSRVQRIHRRIDGLLEFVNFALYDTEVNVPSRTAQPTTIPNYITTLDDKGLTVQPLNIGTLVGPRLREIKHKVLISATLSVNKDFSYIRNHYGLESGDKTVERIYATPFDLKNQAIMYLPTHMPLPKHDGDVNRTEWISAVSTEIAQLVGATNGGAFVLFSAKSDMLDVAKELEPVWDSLGLDLIVQEGDTTATGREFTSGDNKVLFGLKSFWEGIDIPGDKLRLVIIPKLPFPSSSDPVIAALKKAAGDNSFYEVLIPLMFFDMKQGVGRLIRTQADKGFIAILDPRVWTGSINPTTHATRLKTLKLDPNKTRIGYGKDLLNFLGFNSITDDFTVVKKFVNKFFNKG
jgi:Rad3-related DNA helicase